MGPGLRLVAAHPAPGAGTECGPSDPDDCGVPRNTAIELRFDRYVLPSTANRQSLRLFAGRPEFPLFLEPEYDVVERVVRYHLPSGALLAPAVLYTVELIDPEEAAPFGFRALDGSPLADDGSKRRWSFFTARAEVTSAPRRARLSCHDLAATLDRNGCAAGGCHHGGPGAPGDLRLSSVIDIQETAIRRVARSTELGPRLSTPLSDPLRFGVSMPLVDPGNPGNSYLLYKLLANPANYEGHCSTRFTVPLPGFPCPVPSEEERTFLRERFLLGEPMPPAPYRLTLEDLRAIQDAIADISGDCRD